MIDGNPPGRHSKNWSCRRWPTGARTPRCAWDAYRDEDGWVLALRWQAGRSENRADWEIHAGQRTNTLHPKDDAARDLIDPSPRQLRTIAEPSTADIARQITEAAKVAAVVEAEHAPNFLPGTEQPTATPTAASASRHPAGSRRAASGQSEQVDQEQHGRADGAGRASGRAAGSAARRRPPRAPAPTARRPADTARGTGPSCRAGKTSCSAAGKRPASRPSSRRSRAPRTDRGEHRLANHRQAALTLPMVQAGSAPSSIGVLTSGGDASGMNPAVRAVVRTALHHGIDVYAIYEGYQGLVEGGELIRRVESADVAGILQTRRHGDRHRQIEGASAPARAGAGRRGTWWTAASTRWSSSAATAA